MSWIFVYRISNLKRKKTLLVEYKNQFKSNKFVDKRIGENDSKLSLDDKMFKRFVAERQVTPSFCCCQYLWITLTKTFKKTKQKRRDRKSNKYNLNDDDDGEGGRFNGAGGNGSLVNYELTHMGQSIAQMEKFDRGNLSDDDEDDENDFDRGKIGGMCSRRFDVLIDWS